jgi:signal transduction histidine kinase
VNVSVAIPVSLEEKDAPPGQRRAVAVSSIFYTLVVIGLLPFATIRLAPVAAITAVFATAVAVADACTFVLLAAQFRARGVVSVLVLATAYLYSGLMALLHLLTFPGVFLPGAPLLGLPGMVNWLYVSWGVGFVLLLFCAVLPQVRRVAPVQPDSIDHAVFHAVLCTLTAVALLVLISAFGVELSPPQTGDRFSAPDIVLNLTRSVLAIAALVILWRNGNRVSMVDAWLSLALIAAAWGPILTDIGGERYTFGWYAGRVSFIIASAVLLVVLLAESLRLQRALARAVTELELRARLLRAEMDRRELAERKLTEAQKMEAIGRLSGGVAHDFNNLLTTVVSYLELISRTSHDEALRGYAEKAKHVSMRGAKLTQSLLAFGGRQSLKPQRVGVEELLARFALLLQRTLGERIGLRVLGDGNTWPIFVDSTQLEIALLNLALNARDAMANGGVIRLEGRNLAEGKLPSQIGLETGEYVAISVADDGEGMTEDVRAKAFEPFFTTKEVGKGAGLGLSQVRGFVRQSRGEVAIESVPGEGTTVTLYFPRATHA